MARSKKTTKPAPARKPAGRGLADQLAKLQQIGTEIDTAEVTAASANISAWTTENCTGG